LGDPTYAIRESGHIEGQIDYLNLKVGEQTVDLNALHYKHGDFVYCQRWETEQACEQYLALEWLADVTDWEILSAKAKKQLQKTIASLELPPISQYGLSTDSVGPFLCHGMYAARHRVVHKLLKKYSADELRLEFERA
jgi:hypothetical protein